MGIQPSKTELYLPSQTLRECHPDRCWCDRPYHRSSRYVYVERGGDGRERYQDPVDIMSQVMGGGGGGVQMPWKDPRSWTVRDYEKLSEVMEEWAMRENGKSGNDVGGGGRGGGGFPNWPGMQQQQQQSGGGGYWDGSSSGEYGGRYSGRRSRKYVPYDQFEDLKSNFQHMAEQYQRHMSEQEAFLFGSNTDRRKEQYRQNMLNQLKEMMPQLVQMMSAGADAGQQQQMPGFQQQHQQQQQMPNGFAAMPVPGIHMPGPQMMQNPMQQAAAAMNMNATGMGMNNMNPMAAAGLAMPNMNGLSGMPPQMNPMMNMNGAGMMPSGMMGGGVGGFGGMEGQPNVGGTSRRARRRNGFALDDGFDEDYDDFRPRRGGNKRRPAGGNWRDDDDMLGGGGFAGGMHGPRGRVSGDGGLPSRPGPAFRPGSGGLGGSGSGEMAFDDTEPFRSNGVSSSAYGHADTPFYGSVAAQTRFSPPWRRPNYSAVDAAARTAEMRQQHVAMPGSSNPTHPADVDSGGYRVPQAGYDPELYSSSAGVRDSAMAGNTPYTSAAAAAGPSMTLRSAMKRNVGFEGESTTQEAHLARPRGEDSARGETNAGAVPDKRDGMGTI